MTPHSRDPATGIIRGAEPFEFPPTAPPAAAGSHAVLFLHGWTSSPRELRFVAQRVAEAGFHCRGILLPGHGRTVEDLRKIHFGEILDAAETACRELASAHARVSLCGISLGGLLSLYLAARHDISNLVLYAPFLVPGGRTFGLPNALVTRFLPPLNRLIPKSESGPIFDSSARGDHITYPSMPLPGLLENCRAAREVWPLVPGIHCPALAFQSPQDPTSHPSGAERLIRKLGSQDKKLLLVPDSKHVITLDYDRERIEMETAKWLKERR